MKKFINLFLSATLLVAIVLLSSYSKNKSNNKVMSTDYIIVGAGTTGPVVAYRLSEDETVTVCILEAGEENTNDVSRIQGAFYNVWGTSMNWNYNSTQQAELNNRIINHPRGRVVGGSSAINVGAWLRGSEEDYDQWEKLGAKGWNAVEALRIYSTKIEDTDLGPNQYRGKDGMVHVEDIPTASILSDKLVEAFGEAGFGAKADVNAETQLAARRIQSIYKDHVRITPADKYLSDEVRKRNNLSVITGATVQRVLFEGNKAIGVEYLKNGEIITMHANKEVILSAGTFNTPKILKLSGVGPKEELESLGIPVIADVPGVGENLIDHIASPIAVLSPAGVNVSVPMNSSDAAIEEWRKTKNGPAIYWSENSAGFLALTKEAKSGDFEILFGYVPRPDLFEEIEDAAERSGYTINIDLIQPKSRGSVKLASSEPSDAPIIDPRYLSDKQDIETMLEGFRLVSKMLETKTLKEYTAEINPKMDASDEDIVKHIRNTASTVFHPVGTAKMGSLDDPMTVVDEKLKVRGVKGLRVADASVMPMIVRGHTMAPALYIGEMLAEIIKSENK